MVVLLIVLSLAVAGIGLLMSSQATIGVAFIGGGCLLAVLARIAQAARQHDQLVAALKGEQTIEDSIAAVKRDIAAKS